MNLKHVLISSLWLAIIIACLPAQGQKQHNLHDLMRKMQHKTDMLQTQKPNNFRSFDRQFEFSRHTSFPQPVHQSTQSQSRLIAFSLSFFDGVMINPGDSVRFFYSGTNSNPGLEFEVVNNMVYYPSAEPLIEVMDDEILFKTDSFFFYSWDEWDDGFEPDVKIETTFDANGNISSEIAYYYDGIDWELESRILYTYNGQGNPTSIVVQDWTGTIWENEYKHEYSYDSQNNLTEYVRLYWHNASSSWKGNYRKLATYEGTKISNIITQSSFSDSWVNSDRFSMIYTGDLVTEYYEDYWNNDEWVKYGKTLYAYNSSDQLTSEKWMHWNGAEYDNIYRELHNYEQGLRIEFIRQFWDGTNWDYNYKETFDYLNGNVNRVTAANWDNTAFKDVARLYYTNNSYGQPTHVFVEEFDGTDWVQSSSFSIIKLYYEDFEGGPTGLTEKIKIEHLSIYPNPASDYINVKWSDQNIDYIKIVDITGKVVFETKSNFHASDVQIPVNHLPNGVYVLHLENGNHSGTKTFIVRK